jgi:hypothetical protein
MKAGSNPIVWLEKEGRKHDTINWHVRFAHIFDTKIYIYFACNQLRDCNHIR